MRPAQRPVRAVERVHVALQVLHVDRLAVGDRRRREDARVRRCGRQSESPAHLELRDVAGVDGRSGRGARAREIAVGQFPGAVGVLRSATGEEPRDGGRHRDAHASFRSRSHRRCYAIGREVAPFRARSGVRSGARAGGSELWSAQTTAPPPVVTIKVMITDSKIAMIPRRAQRGVMAQFILINRGAKPHTFKLGHQTTWNRDADRIHQGSQAERAEHPDLLPRLPRQASVPRPSSRRPIEAGHEGDLHDLLKLRSAAARRCRQGASASGDVRPAGIAVLWLCWQRVDRQRALGDEDQPSSRPATSPQGRCR